MPLFRKERSYTFSAGLTKVFTSHDLRVGVDVVRHSLNHIQAEFGDIGGVRGGFRFNGTVTGVPGYTPLLWNEFGTFLLGLQTYQGKDVQTEEMTGREWQSAIYLRDRWNVNPNFTISAGLRLEHYPLMSRDGRGLERLDLATYEALIGGLGNTPDDVGINMKTWYFAPRLGAMYRFGEKAVARAGYGRTINPLPWSRPMRGSFPQDIFYNRTADQFADARHARGGHSAGAGAGHQLGPCAAPARRLHAVAEPERRRSRHHPAVERGLRVPPAVGHRGGGGLRRDAPPTAAMPTST